MEVKQASHQSCKGYNNFDHDYESPYFAMSQPYKRQTFSAPAAPAPNGNYSHAVLQQSATLHVAGWMGDDPKTGDIVEGGIGAQTVSIKKISTAPTINTHIDHIQSQHQAMHNIRACLEAGGSSLEKVVRRRIYIIDIKQFREIDAIWAEYVKPPFPVSTCVQVSFLLAVLITE